MIEIKIDGASFNATSFLQQFADGMTEQDFIEGRLREPVYTEYSDSDRRTLLKMVYDEIVRSGQSPLQF